MTRKLFPQFEQSYFPDPRTYAFPDWALVGDYYYQASDIVTFGTPLTAETAAEAYRKGIFPWYMRGIPLPWYCPEQRAVLEFKDLHIPRSLAKARRQQPFKFTIDRDFGSVMKACAAAKRPEQGGTWITGDFQRVYTELHKKGMAHSVEVWDGGTLVGGLYGVDAGGVFCGESMFYRAPNASKLALLYLIDHLRSRGSDWLDIQVMTPHMEALGAKEIRRVDFLDRLRLAQDQKQKGLIYCF
ncbi:MAG: leucyl/phenylalanyl-tRNA--protein transferase [Acidobacteria bacterium]|nr:leucyl/phenylalanyl-tRNA--protein transferase [Acidobacteriota bacterium]